MTTNLGTNLVSQNYFHETYGNGPAFAGEFIGTAILCYGTESVSQALSFVRQAFV